MRIREYIAVTLIGITAYLNACAISDLKDEIESLKKQVYHLEEGSL